VEQRFKAVPGNQPLKKQKLAVPDLLPEFAKEKNAAKLLRQALAK